MYTSTFQQAEFAADLSRVHEGTATPEYQNPTLFFQRTFITEGMRLLLDSVVKRLAGRGGDPVIQLQTACGGGKTHTMLAVYHLAKGDAVASDLPGVEAHHSIYHTKNCAPQAASGSAIAVAVAIATTTRLRFATRHARLVLHSAVNASNARRTS